jgi:hypothetical protein
LQSRFEAEAATVEPRYRQETVQKAVAVAQRLQQERRETLSLSDIDDIAAEIGIDPQILRAALQAIAAKEAEAARASAAHEQVRVSPAVQQRRAPLVLAGALLFGLTLGTSALLIGRSRVTLAPPIVLPPPTVMAPYPALANGDFELGPQSETTLTGDSAIPGWTVEGSAKYHPRLGRGTGALELSNGNGVRQVFPTIPGQSYRVTVDVSGVPQSVAAMGRVELILGNFSTIGSVFVPARGTGAAPWNQAVLEFRAIEAGTPIQIKGPPDAGAPLIDNVRVMPIERSAMPLQ